MPFRKVTTRPVSPPGLERKILRDIPKVLIGGLIVPILFVVFMQEFPPQDLTPNELEKYLDLSEIVAIAVAITVWTAALTVSIGCIFVMVMKGPVYEADSYRVNDRAAPSEAERTDEDHPAKPEEHDTNRPGGPKR